MFSNDNRWDEINRPEFNFQVCLEKSTIKRVATAGLYAPDEELHPVIHL